MKNGKEILLLIFIVLSVPVLSATIGNFHGFGNSVQINLAFHIDNNDVYNATDDYVYSQNGTTIFALIPQSSFGTRVISGTNNVLQAKSIVNSGNSRFFIVFTNGTKNNIEEKIAEAKTGMIGKTFGQVSYEVPASYLVFLRLIFDYNLLSNIHMKGNNEVLIRNEGLDEKNNTKISMTIVG